MLIFAKEAQHIWPTTKSEAPWPSSLSNSGHNTVRVGSNLTAVQVHFLIMYCISWIQHRSLLCYQS